MFFIKLLDYTVNKVIFMDVNVKPIKLSRLQYILFGFELYKKHFIYCILKCLLTLKQ